MVYHGRRAADAAHGREMNEHPPSTQGEKGDLREAVRRARLEDAERSDVVAELRSGALARLELVAAALAPVLAELPEGIDLFDHGLVAGEQPRFYVDVLAFVEVDRDRRTYRFLVDTRHGRRVLAASEDVDTIRRAVTDYVARRLVEREKALAADGGLAATPLPPPANGHGGDLLFAFVMGAIVGATLFYLALWWKVLG